MGQIISYKIMMSLILNYEDLTSTLLRGRREFLFVNQIQAHPNPDVYKPSIPSG